MSSDEGKQGDSRRETGGIIPGSDVPAYTLAMPEKSRMPVLIAAPHGGRAYPPELLANMRDAELSAIRLEDRYVDLLAVEVARQTGVALLSAQAPRAMLDLNRAQDDIDWGMIAGGEKAAARHSYANRRARSGLGLVPRRLPGFGEIWRVPLGRAELDARIAGIHRPYHAALGRVMEDIRDEWGAALLIDLHSMPPLRRSYGSDQPAKIVIGDRFGASCHSSITGRALKHLETNGHAVSLNRPYSGGFVLDRHATPSRGLHAVQLEICRSSYLDDVLREVSESLIPLSVELARLVQELGHATARLGEAGRLAQAAE